MSVAIKVLFLLLILPYEFMTELSGGLFRLPCPHIDLHAPRGVHAIGSSQPPDYANAAAEQGAAGGCIPRG